MEIFLIRALQLIMALSLLVLIHEFGHFLFAKKFGVTISEFSLGMGPKLISWKGKKNIFTFSYHALKDEIKAYMGNSEELRAGEYKVTWKPVTSSRLDTAALKKAMPDLVERFTKTTTTRRFTVR